MTKNPRDHREWTLEELESDAQGYLAAQQAYKEDRAKAQAERDYADDLARFTEAFVEAGGDEKDGEAAFAAHRNERAAEVAREADESALRWSRQRLAGRL